ncbi:unnamed protein product, partial [Owenia fusiformis]
ITTQASITTAPTTLCTICPICPTSNPVGNIVGGVFGSLIAIGIISVLAFWVFKVQKENKHLKVELHLRRNSPDKGSGTHGRVNLVFTQAQSEPYDVVDFTTNNCDQLNEDDVNISFPNVCDDAYPMDTIDIGATLGAGEFGVVKLVNVNNNVKAPFIAAAKILKDNASDDDHQDLLRELELMKQLPRHNNVVELLGFSITHNGHTMILVEYLPLGDLHSYLRANKAKYIQTDKLETSKELIQFGWQVAKGMEHISSHKFLHRDLAARNVLLSARKVCKISDFGLSRDVGEGNVYNRKSKGRLPIRWMSPEAIFHNIYTTKNDVWAYGILLWEILTFGSTPYPGMKGKDVMELVK